MKIAINLFLASPRSVTGAFKYLENILPHLFRRNSGNAYYLIGRQETINYFKASYQDSPNVRFHVFDIRRDLWVNPIRAARKLLAKMRRDGRATERIIASEVNRFLREQGIEVYFSPTGAIYPRGLERVAAVTNMLDLQPEYFPENFSSSYLAQRKEDSRYAVEHSRRLIAISGYTKQTLVEKYGADPEKITAIHLAPNKMDTTPAAIETPQEFLLYPAALWKHKNHHVLIKALGILKDRFPALQVVCTGGKGGAFKKELESMVEAEGLEGRVRFLGYVAGNLKPLYLHAKALVFPSSFEGFGIPIVEAFELGLPVIAADNSSLTEIVGDAGLLVPTGDAEALAKAIERVMTDVPLREELIRKGRERAKLFSWEKTVEETLEVFKSIYSPPS